MKKNILITCGGGGGPIYLARELQKFNNVFLVDGGDQNAAPYLGFPFQKIPFGSSPDFAGEMKKLIATLKIDCVVPGADEELLPVAALQRENPSLMAVLPSADFITLCLNKKRLMQELARAGISELLPYTKCENVAYPAIMKPVFGRGSRQVHTVQTPEQLDGYLKLYDKTFDEVLVQPCIEGVEYTVSVIVNNRNALIGIVPKKIIEKKGITRAAVAEQNERITALCTDIVAKYKPGGPFNVQLKMWNDTPYVFEINPRLSTTSVLTSKAFGNEVELYLRYYDQDIITDPPTFKEGVRLFRYDENILP